MRGGRLVIITQALCIVLGTLDWPHLVANYCAQLSSVALLLWSRVVAATAGGFCDPSFNGRPTAMLGIAMGGPVTDTPPTPNHMLVYLFT
jgi:hypothetical protein